MKNLNKKLSVIQTELKAKKSSYNSFGKYYFRKAEDILEAVKPFLIREGESVDCDEELVHDTPPTQLNQQPPFLMAKIQLQLQQ